MSNPSAPHAVGSVRTDLALCAVVSGSYAYVVNAGSDTLRVFDVIAVRWKPVGSAGTGSNLVR
ncbi:MAG: hypothetical protein U1G07_08875 [Verrucomicrobiota bacterium]